MQRRIHNKIYSAKDIAKHRSVDDCWIIIGEPHARKVYDITSFLDDHPGGPEILIDLAGQDANEAFVDVQHSSEARKLLETFYLGDVDSVPQTLSKAVPQTSSKSLSQQSVSRTWVIVLLVFFITMAWCITPVH